MIHRAGFLIGLIAAVMLGGSGSAAQAEDLIYINDAANRLLTLDPATGHVERIGTTNAQFTDIAFSPDGRLFGVSPTYLYEIDPDNAWSTLIGRHGFGEPGHSYGIDALTFTPDGTLYGAGNDVLLTFDLTTGAANAVGDLSGFRSAGDVTVDTLGRLLLSTDAGMLVQALPDGSGARPIGALPYDDLFALATDSTGVIYGVRPTNELVTINPETGCASFAEQLEADFVLANAWGASTPFPQVPEPGTLVLGLAGMVLVLRRRRPIARIRPHRS